MMKESDILFEKGNFWVLKINNIFHVMKNTVTHSETLCAFKTLDLAIAYANYNGRRELGEI